MQHLKEYAKENTLEGIKVDMEVEHVTSDHKVILNLVNLVVIMET